MNTNTFRRWAAVRGSVVAIMVAIAAGGSTTAHGADNAPAVAEAKAPAKGGAQLWAENCARCHNVRSPASYSDAQWEVALMHMRVRANLTAEEYKKVLEFLKSAN